MKTKQYEAYMESVQNFCGTRFLASRFDLIRFLECDGTAVIVLTWYINLLVMKDGKIQDRKTLKDNEMFFRCPAKDMEKELKIAHDKRIRVNNCLEKLGFIEIDHRAGNLTWVRVNVDKLNEVQRWDRENNQPPDDADEKIRSRETRNQKSGNPKSEVGKPEIPTPSEPTPSSEKTSKSKDSPEASKNTNKKTNNTVGGHESSTDARSARPVLGRRDREISELPSSKQSSSSSNDATSSYKNSKSINTSESSPQSGRSAPLPRKETDPVKELAEWFYAECKKKRLDSPTTKSIKTWITEFRELIEKTIMPEQELGLGEAISYLKDLLTDHIANAEDEHQPKAFCGREVHKRYRDLLAARKRRRVKKRRLREQSDDGGIRTECIRTELGDGRFKVQIREVVDED